MSARQSTITARTVAIIGGGASGLVCAVELARALEACGARDTRDARQQVRIVVLEAGPKVGRPVLVSGNGRCNFSNRTLIESDERTCYHNAAFVERAVAQLRSADGAAMDTVSWFESLGLVWREASAGMLYPYSNQATSVLEVLLGACERYGVELVVDTRITAVEAREGASEAHFLLRGEQAREVSRTVTAKGRVKRELAWERYEFAADQVVVAVGGVEAAALVPGCTWKPMRPLLVPVRTEVDAISGLDGLRVAVDLRIPERSFSEHGEVLFRTYGLSGIVVLNASRYARPGDLLELDFAPDWSLDELRTSLACRLDRSSWHAAERPSFAQVLQGFLPAKLTAVILKQAGLDPSHPATADGLASFGASCKSFPLQVRGLAVEQACQVHRGGVSVKDVDPASLRVLGVPGLTVLGEALDVDGPCGGYNLDWAWTTGLIAARALAHELASPNAED